MLEERSKPAPAPARPPLPNSWLAIIAGLTVCSSAAILLAIVFNQHVKARSINLREETLARSAEVLDLLRSNLVDSRQIRQAQPQLVETENTSWYSTSFDVETEGIEPEGLVAVLARTMAGRDVRVAEEPPSDRARQLDLSLAGCKFAEVRLHLPPPPPLPPLSDDDPVLMALNLLAGIGQSALCEPEPAARTLAAPRVAIILDDGGYGGPVTEAVLKLDAGLTLSILPGAPDAADTARRAAKKKFEVMLHLPMESPEDPGWIAASTPSEEMARLLDEALERVPGAAGINNHMGSVFCTDQQALARFFDVMKTRAATRGPLFFVDSRTTHETRIPDAARQAGVPVGERKVFLDNDGGNGQIREQFDRLVQFALQNKTAIGIGHFRQTTVEALAELLPELQKHGIKLIHASEVVQ